MSSSTDIFFNLGNLVGMGSVDLNSNSTTPQMRPGSISIVQDAFGTRILKYIKCVNSTAVAKAETMSYASDGANVKTTTISNISSGSTTYAVTSGLTANRHNGMICFVLDDAGAAGAAPEAEMTIVSTNTTTTIYFEPDYALSTALAANDDLELIATYQVEDAADGDEAWTVAGVVLGQDGIAASSYGWIQQQGPCPVLVTTNAITEGDPVVAGAAIMDAFGTDGQELWTGIALASGSTDEATPHIPVDVRLFTCAGPGGSP